MTTFTFDRLEITACAQAGFVYCWDAETDNDWVESIEDLQARAERVAQLPYEGSAGRAALMRAAAEHFSK